MAESQVKLDEGSSTEKTVIHCPIDVKMANAQCKLRDGRVIPVVIEASKVDWMLSNENDICRQVERVVGPNIVPTKPILLKVSPNAYSIPEDANAINRYTWHDAITEKLLDTIKLWWKPLKLARNKRAIWTKIAEQVAPDLNADKVIDKWKFLKKKYRKMYPEPFMFSDKIKELVGDLSDQMEMNANVDFLTIDENGADTDAVIIDALFEPPTKKRKTGDSESRNGSTQQITTPHHQQQEQEQDQEEQHSDSVRLELFHEFKKLLEERDEKMMQMFRQFQADTVKLMKQLIDKFPDASQ